MVKYAILSDIHSNYISLLSTVNELKEKNVNKYIFLGDYILDGFDTNNVLDLIKSLDAFVIKGNKEDYFDLNEPNFNWYIYKQYYNLAFTYESLTKENLSYIKSLPKILIKEIEGLKVCMIHTLDSKYRDFKDIDESVFDDLIQKYNCDVFLFGHTHIRFYKKYKNRYFINPGSVGMPIDGNTIKYGIITFNNKNIEYEECEIQLDYKRVENYYKNSDFYSVVDSWAKLCLMNIKDGFGYSVDFVDKLRTKLSSLNIDTKNGIANKIWTEEFYKYIKEKGLENYI